ncbi:hypothetical protein [Fuscovulum ytuae]|uniref:Uncharacterized protein n=1 Tax=Fuscovulum ytuae TaxID=3042299 RepID=A0ABY8Q2E7_9RHOB|nr:hypothetical protein [Fuscovulum sp. YMD61]WGV14971.1 hypothetical protein QF092_11810 [Fuscovulum sp. YMD61]
MITINPRDKGYLDDGADTIEFMPLGHLVCRGHGTAPHPLKLEWRVAKRVRRSADRQKRAHKAPSDRMIGFRAASALCRQNESNPARSLRCVLGSHDVFMRPNRYPHARPTRHSVAHIPFNVSGPTLCCVRSCNS